jgi:hypothetical protein
MARFLERLAVADGGQHALKGVPGDWRIFAVDMN